LRKEGEEPVSRRAEHSCVTFPKFSHAEGGFLEPGGGRKRRETSTTTDRRDLEEDRLGGRSSSRKAVPREKLQKDIFAAAGETSLFNFGDKKKKNRPRERVPGSQRGVKVKITKISFGRVGGRL